MCFDLCCVARAWLWLGHPSAKCEIGLMSSPFFTLYIFHCLNYISATKPQLFIAYSSLTRKHSKTIDKWLRWKGDKIGLSLIRRQGRSTPFWYVFSFLEWLASGTPAIQTLERPVYGEESFSMCYQFINDKKNKWKNSNPDQNLWGNLVWVMGNWDGHQTF